MQITEYDLKQANLTIDSTMLTSTGWKHKWLRRGEQPYCNPLTKEIATPPFGHLDVKQNRLVRGYNIHEVGHAQNTPVCHETAKNPALFFIANALEDMRIEAIEANRFAGAGPALFETACQVGDETRAIMNDPQKAAQVKPVAESLYWLGLEDRGVSPGWQMSPEAKKYYDAIRDLFVSWRNLPNILDGKNGHPEMLKLAKKILEKLKEEKKNQKEQEQQEQEKKEKEKKDKEQEKQDKKDQKDQQDKKDQKGQKSDQKDQKGEKGEKGQKGDQKGEKGEQGKGEKSSHNQPDIDDELDDEKEEKEDKDGNPKKDKSDKNKKGQKNEKQKSEKGEDDDGEDDGDSEDEDQTDEGDEDEGDGKSSDSGDKDTDEDGDDVDGKKEGKDKKDKKDKKDSKGDKSEKSDGDKDGDEDGDEDGETDGETGKDDLKNTDPNKSPRNKKETKEEAQKREEEYKKRQAQYEREAESELQSEFGKSQTLSNIMEKEILKVSQETLKDDPDHYASDKSRDTYEVADMNERQFQESRSAISNKIQQMSSFMEQIFRSIARVSRQANMDIGRLDKRKLHLLAKSVSKNVFYKKRNGKELNTCVSMIVDESGSMHGQHLEMQKLLIAFSEVMVKLHIPFEVIGFSTHNNIYLALPPDITRNNPMRVKFYKTWKENYNIVKYRLGSVYHYNNNIDGEDMEIAAYRMSIRKEKRKILLVFSDGSPCSGHGNDGVMCSNIKTVAKRLRNSGIEVYAFGVNTREPERYYGKEHFVYMDSGEGLSQTFFKEVYKIMAKGICKVDVSAMK